MEKETLGDAAAEYSNKNYATKDLAANEDWYISWLAFNNGGKWQQERSYSEAEVLKIINKFNEVHYHPSEECEITEWFEQFKKMMQVHVCHKHNKNNMSDEYGDDEGWLYIMSLAIIFCIIIYQLLK